MDELTNEQILKALRRCVGAYGVGAEKGCEECPLYEDHYCVDTLCSLIKERIEGRNKPTGGLFGWKVE